MADTLREEFEAWTTGPEGAWIDGAVWRDSNGNYGELEIAREWEIWQAATRAALASRPAEVGDEGLPPSDCSGTPASCPDNEGYGCHCSQVAEAVMVDRLAITKMVSESMQKYGVRYQCGMGGMIVDIMEKFGIPPSHTTNKEK